MRSRYQRPTAPRGGLVPQERDRQVLRAVAHHRVVRGRHVHALLFSGVSQRTCQQRLRRLWEWRYLDRLYLPLVVDGSGARPLEAGAPLYVLGRRAMLLLADELGDRPQHEAIDTTPVTMATIQHRMVVTEVLVSLQLACRGRTDIVLESFSTEAPLWRMLQGRRARAGAVVPDAAFTLRYKATQQAITFYVEVVRADVRGGSRRLLQKMQRYVELNRNGFFKHVYCHERLRAVLFLTPSAARAENLRRLARQLEHGRRLFWFGAYHHDRRQLGSAITPATILIHSWRDADDRPTSLLAPSSSSPHAPATCPTPPTRHAPDPR